MEFLGLLYADREKGVVTATGDEVLVLAALVVVVSRGDGDINRVERLLLLLMLVVVEIDKRGDDIGVIILLLLVATVIIRGLL